MKISINQLRLELADIEAGHLQLNTFFWGDFPRAVNEENINYPLMAGYYPTAGFLDNQTSLPITIVIADKIYEDHTNLNDVESDTLQYCRDVFNIMNKSTRWQKLGRVESCSLTKFIEGNADVCAGHIMTVNFTLRDSNSICDLPMSGYDFDQDIASSCLPVQIYRNGVLVDTVASGGTYSYTTDAFTYTIKNTDLVTLYSGNVTANLSVTIQDATVSNSDASYSTSIVAQGNLDLPDITVGVINSLDVVVSTQISASVKDVTISAPDGTINIKKTGDGTISSQSVPSGATVNYNVGDNAITVNGANGFTIDATDPLDIVLTDTTGATLTPVSVTPNVGLHKVDIVLPTSAPSFDSDTQRFIDATAITDTIIQNAIDVAVVALKDNGLWSGIYAWYPFVGGSATTHKFNAKDSRDTDDALRLTFFGGITHNANGITGNGSTGYADTHFNMLSGGIYRESFGMSQYIRNAGWSGYAHGIFDGGSSFSGMLRSGTDLYYFVYGDTSAVGTVATATKLLTQQRSASNLTTLYRSGSSVATSTGATQAFINETMYLLGRNTLGSALGLSTANLASTLIHKAFSGAEVATLNTIIETFETSLGRNV